jgi:hypothetical protein
VGESQTLNPKPQNLKSADICPEPDPLPSLSIIEEPDMGQYNPDAPHLGVLKLKLKQLSLNSKSNVSLLYPTK